MNAIHGTRQFDEGSSQARPHILHVFPSFAVGGVPVRIATMINRLGHLFHHTILALDGCYGASEGLDPATQARIGSGTLGDGSRWGPLPVIRRTLAAERPDLLATYNWGSIEWALVNMVYGFCPHLHFESGFGREEADQQLWRRAMFRRVALARSARVVVPSRTLADVAGGNWKIPRRRLQVIPNGVDCAAFSGEPGQVTNDEFRREPGQLIIGTVAPLRPEKNLERLLRIFADFISINPGQDVRLVIAGDGAERARLERAAQDFGIDGRTVFTGHRSDVAAVLKGLDVFVMTSDTEQMPNSLLQAMATGRPVLATDVGDVKEMVAAENRPFVLARHDGPGLVNGLAALLGDREKRGQLGRANQSRARSLYGMEHMVEAYRDLFLSACAAK